MRYLAIHHRDGVTQHLRDEPAIIEAFRSERGLLWLHLLEPDEADATLLQDQLRLHPLAVEDCLSQRHERPKVDDYGDYLFLVLHGIDYAATAQVVSTAELDIFVGRTYVISASAAGIPAVQHLADTIDRLPPSALEHPALLAHLIADALVDSILPVVDRMNEVTDAVEETALELPDRPTLQRVLHLKRSVQRLHRVTVPQREVFYRISRGDYPLLSNSAALFFRDVFDHLVRLEDTVTALRERADGALTTYLSAVNIRQNETMRTVSVAAAIFLPLSLITGIYGMNFQHMPELEWPWAYFAVLGAMVAIALGITWFVFLRHWLRERLPARRLPTFAIDPRHLDAALSEAAQLRHRVLAAAHLARRREG